MSLYTIGHSNHPVDEFIRLLKSNGILTLVDIRSAPHSRFYPHFNKARLQIVLPERNIEYIYEGASLGGRPKDPTCYVDNLLPATGKDYLHKVSYPEVMQRPWFHQGIERLLELAGQKSTCIMCSEGDPAQCHRHHLIAAYLMSHHPQVAVLHILRDGKVIEAQSL